MNKKNHRIFIIGSGNIAFYFGKLFFAKGYTISGVYSRNKVTGEELSAAVNTSYYQTLEIPAATDIVLICVQDQYISLIVEALQKQNLQDILVLHTSGATDISVLSACRNYGVLYPFQSIRKEKPLTEEIPLLLEGCNAEVLSMVKELAHSISSNVQEMSSLQRQQLHVAAIFVSNFPNYVWALAESFCISNGLDFSILLPLINETAGRISTNSPSNVQTGPAIRGDMATIETHKSLIKDPELADVYNFLTEKLLKTTKLKQR